MRRRFMRMVTAAACLAVSSAGASVSTRIEVSNLRVRLTALAPGVTPVVAFTSDVGSTAQADCLSGPPAAQQARAVASGRAFGPAAATVGDRFSGGAASIAGNAFGAAGADVRTSAWASSLVAQSGGDATIGLVDGVSTASFTLAPWTAMTISADVRASAASTGAGGLELSNSGLLMAVGDSTGIGPQFAYVNFNAFATGWMGAVDDEEATFVSLSYDNWSDNAISGLFSGYVSSYASSGSATSAVPEPPAAGLLAIGLAVLAIALAMKKAGGSRPFAGVVGAARAPKISLPTCR